MEKQLMICYAVDWDNYSVLKADKEKGMAWLQLKYKEIKTSQSTETPETFGGYPLDFPVCVHFTELPLPEDIKREFRWVKRHVRRPYLNDSDTAKILGGFTLEQWMNEIIYERVVAPRLVNNNKNIDG